MNRTVCFIMINYTESETNTVNTESERHFIRIRDIHLAIQKGASLFYSHVKDIDIKNKISNYNKFCNALILCRNALFSNEPIKLLNSMQPLPRCTYVLPFSFSETKFINNQFCFTKKVKKYAYIIICIYIFL